LRSELIDEVITVVAHDDITNGKISISINDTRIGMSRETLEKIFDMCVRAKNANQINVTGTGLFVAKKMVTEMKGRAVPSPLSFRSFQGMRV